MRDIWYYERNNVYPPREGDDKELNGELSLGSSKNTGHNSNRHGGEISLRCQYCNENFESEELRIRHSGKVSKKQEAKSTVKVILVSLLRRLQEECGYNSNNYSSNWNK